MLTKLAPELRADHACLRKREEQMPSSPKFMRLASSGKLTIPHDIRERLGLKPGDKGYFILREDGVLTLRFDENLENASDHSKEIQAS